MSETHSAVPERSSEKLRTTPQPINKTDASGTMTAALSRRFLSPSLFSSNLLVLRPETVYNIYSEGTRLLLIRTQRMEDPL